MRIRKECHLNVLESPRATNEFTCKSPLDKKAKELYWLVFDNFQQEINPNKTQAYLGLLLLFLDTRFVKRGNLD